MANIQGKPVSPGDVFGKLTVLRPLKSPERPMYMCKCACGEKEVVVSLASLRNGKTHCGCDNPLKRREAVEEENNGFRVIAEADPTDRLQKGGKYVQKVRRVKVECIVCKTRKIAYLSNFRAGKIVCQGCK